MKLYMINYKDQDLLALEKKEDIYSNIDEMLSSTLDSEDNK